MKKHLRPGIRIKLGKAYSGPAHRNARGRLESRKFRRVLFCDEHGAELATVDVPLDTIRVPYGSRSLAARIKVRARSMLFKQRKG